MLSKIFLGDHFDGYHTINEGEVLNNLSKVNIFIGENNSGKSRFLRKIFIQEDYEVASSLLSFEDLHNSAKEFMNSLKSATSENVENIDAISNGSRIDIILLINTIINRASFKYKQSTSFIKDINNTINTLKSLEAVRRYKAGETWRNLNPRESENFKAIIHTQIEKLIKIIPENFSDDYEKLYIPILRGVRPIHVNNSSLFDNRNNYKERTLKDYFHEVQFDKLNVFTGLSLYEDIRYNLLNKVEKRKLIRDFEIFIGDTFFNKKTISLIPHIDKDVLEIGIGDDPEREIYNLGDGIQALIILLYPLFIHKGENMIFCFEEPETHLHPGMQRVFLEALQREEFNTFQYFITTHSNHFLDLTLDMNNMSIYTFKKKEQEYLIENVSSGDSNVLELIGVRNSSVFLSNCTIWVEGITDRLYVKKYLDLYQDRLIEGGFLKSKFLEDIHFSFVEYGGNNITHWSFLDTEDDDEERINVDRLCSKLFLITDNDGANENNKDWKHERFEKLKANLKERYYKLEAIEIENLLPKQAIKNYIIKKEKNNEQLKFVKFDENEHTATPLGHFIEKNVVGFKLKYKEAGTSKTIRNKLEFCKGTLEYVNDYNDLTPEAKELCEKIINFIKSNNK